MNEKTGPDKKHVMVESRKQRFVTCPHCWTEQRTERNFCYFCGAEFVYLDEQKKRING
jgi:predicted amidophosphoribosyltransferase